MINYQFWMYQVSIIATVVLSIVCIGGMLFFIYIIKKYNIGVDFLRDVGNNRVEITRTDRAKIVMEDGVTKLKYFRQRKKTSPFFGSKYLYPRNTLLTKYKMYMLEDNAGDFHPITMDPSSLQFKARNVNITFFRQNEQKKVFMETQKLEWWKQQMPIIIGYGVLLLIVVVFIVYAQKVETVVHSAQEVSGALVKAAESLERFSENMPQIMSGGS